MVGRLWDPLVLWMNNTLTIYKNNVISHLNKYQNIKHCAGVFGELLITLLANI